MPTAAYEVGPYHVDKDGTLTGPDSRTLISLLSGLHGFTADSTEYDESAHGAQSGSVLAAEVPAEPDAEPAEETDDEADGFGMQPAAMLEEDHITIELPRPGYTDLAIANLRNTVMAKQALIKKALGVDTVDIEVTEDCLRFPWFSADTKPDVLDAYIQFICALGTQAKTQKRATAKEREFTNFKYSFRCLLLRLGFIGDSYYYSVKLYKPTT
jgi:hypothetical protein